MTIETIGRYQVEKLLGRGAMGMVYKGYDPGIDRHVAIKMVHRNLLSGDEAEEWLQRFRREARAAGRCLHQNIVTVFEYGEQDDAPYIAMEFIEGEELADVLKRQKVLERDKAVAIVGQVLDALDYAHAHNIVHRDIKPANIILLPGDRVKVADFGIARIDSTSMTAHGSVVGTPSYMSPEQFTGQDIDKRTDIFSAGVVLFELLTGHKPFPGKRATEVMYKLLNHAPRPVTELNPSLPIAMNAVVLKALSRNPDDRFATAAEFKQMLLQAEATAPAMDDATVLMQAPPRPTAPSAPSGQADDSSPFMASPTEETGIRNEETLRQVAEALSYHIGPVAKVVVEQAAKQTEDLGTLYRTVATSIQNADDRESFLSRGNGAAAKAQAAAAPAAAPAAVSISPDEIVRAQRALAVHLGPIAKVMVKRAVPTAGSFKELCEKLAEHIPNDKERAAFLAQVQ